MCMATTQEGGGHRGPEPAMWAGGAARVGKNEEGGPSCKQEVFSDAPDPCLHLPGQSGCLPLGPSVVLTLCYVVPSIP